MQEPEGEFAYYLSIKNKTCELIEGPSPKPVCEIITDISTWEDIGGKYISPGEAVKSGRL
ncbi:MAG: SCP2 sterol-binding domain-containing protein [bacterium]|nr:SCP2 sterol-binding domain-containing protein [bacterium]